MNYYFILFILMQLYVIFRMCTNYLFKCHLQIITHFKNSRFFEFTFMILHLNHTVVLCDISIYWYICVYSGLAMPNVEISVVLLRSKEYTFLFQLPLSNNQPMFTIMCKCRATTVYLLNMTCRAITSKLYS